MIKERYLPPWMQRDEKTGKLVFRRQQPMPRYDICVLQSSLLSLVEDLENTYEMYYCARFKPEEARAELEKLMYNIRGTLRDSMEKLEAINRELEELQQQNFELRYQLFEEGLRDSVFDN